VKATASLLLCLCTFDRINNVMLIHLNITNFRNFKNVDIDLGTKINVFYGLNGSGKTSLLEAIYYLGLGRSFRTRQTNRVIQHSSTKFSLFGEILQADHLTTIPIGIEREQDGSSTIRIAGKNAKTALQLCERLPLQLINTDSYRLISDGPLYRRQFLDWGVFHQDNFFYEAWQRSQRILKQRNAGLKTAISYQQIKLWDEEFLAMAYKLDEYRSRYISEFIPLFLAVLSSLLTKADMQISYHRGWNPDKNLQELLEASFSRDKLLGYTQFGPHRADLRLKINAIPAQDVLSQGQQKLVAYALRLAQGRLLQQQTGKNCIYLVDDLPAELDNNKRQLVAEILAGMNSQIFVTGIEPQGLIDLSQLQEAKMFHVERGSIAM
jgi:DNA replication and repair protein RecF